MLSWSREGDAASAAALTSHSALQTAQLGEHTGAEAGCAFSCGGQVKGYDYSLKTFPVLGFLHRCGLRTSVFLH